MVYHNVTCSDILTFSSLEKVFITLGLLTFYQVTTSAISIWTFNDYTKQTLKSTLKCRCVRSFTQVLVLSQLQVFWVKMRGSVHKNMTLRKWYTSTSFTHKHIQLQVLLESLLKQVSSRYFSYLYLSIKSEENHLHSMILPPPCVTMKWVKCNVTFLPQSILDVGEKV